MAKSCPLLAGPATMWERRSGHGWTGPSGVRGNQPRHLLRQTSMSSLRCRTDRVRSFALGLVPILVSLGVIVGAAPPADASCAAPTTLAEEIQRADLVVVGVVAAVENRDRWATVAVEEVWKGAWTEGRLNVRAGPADPPGGTTHAMSSVDRTYVVGTRYLIFASDPKAHRWVPSWGSDGRFEDNNCSESQPYVAATLDRFRPTNARRVATVGARRTPSTRRPAPFASRPARDNREGLPTLWFAGAAIVALGVVVGVRRRSTAGDASV